MSLPLSLLERGQVFQKFDDRSSGVASTIIWADLKEGKLYWDKEGSRVKQEAKSSRISDLAFVSTQTDGHDIFEENVHASMAPEKQVLVLEYHPPSRTLFLQAPTPEVRKAWAQAMQAWSSGGPQAAAQFRATTSTGNLAVEVSDESAYRANGGQEKKYSGATPVQNLMTPSPGAPAQKSPAGYQQANGANKSPVFLPNGAAASIQEEEYASSEEEEEHTQMLSVNGHNKQQQPQKQPDNSPLQSMFALPPQQKQPAAAAASTSSSASKPASTNMPVLRSTPSLGNPKSQPAAQMSSGQSHPPPSSAAISYFDSFHPPEDRLSAKKHSISLALESIQTGVSQRLKQKQEDFKKLTQITKVNAELLSKNKELESKLKQQGNDGSRAQEKIQDLESELVELRERDREHDLEWNSLAILTGSQERGKIEIRLATHNLEHDQPHQYVAVLYVKNPLEEEFEYSQTCSLNRSVDGVTYLPKLILSPTELFAFRHADNDDEEEPEEEDEADDDASDADIFKPSSSPSLNKRRSSQSAKSKSKKSKKQQQDDEGELVGAQLKIEIWDLFNKQLYGEPDHSDGDHSEGYQGHVEIDMNDLIAARHHVLSMDISNSLSQKKEKLWRQQGVKLVLQYCLPVTEEDSSSSNSSLDPSRAKTTSSSILAGASSDPLLTLRLQALEEELEATRKAKNEFLEEYNIYKEQALMFQEERRARLALEQRLINEQIIRVKQEQEVMRLKPRALELVDTSDELLAAKKKMKELEFTVTTLQKELRKSTLPPTPHAMLDELLSLSHPTLTDLVRIKKFILEQERVRCMLVEEMSSSMKTYVSYETTHDELIRRENALNTHIHFLEDEKRKLQVQNNEFTQSLHTLQAETLQLSKRCAQAEQSKELMEVNLTFLTENAKIQRKKIEELERALLVHHSQMSGFEIAHKPVPQQVEKQYKLDRAADDELDAQLARAQWELDHPQPDEPDAAAGKDGPQEDHPSQSAIAAAQRAPRRTKVVYSDALEQTLSAAGSNWNAKKL